MRWPRWRRGADLSIVPGADPDHSAPGYGAMTRFALVFINALRSSGELPPLALAGVVKASGHPVWPR